MLATAARRGAFSGLAAQAVQVAAQFVSLWFLARHLSASEFGEAGLALAVVGLVGVGADLGMGVLVVQRREIDVARARLLAIGAGFLACATVLLGALTSSLVPGVSRFLPWTLGLAAMSLPLAGVSSVPRSLRARSAPTAVGTWTARRGVARAGPRAEGAWRTGTAAL
jgi:O-antigen/teichoic acid export membrane protein